MLTQCTRSIRIKETPTHTTQAVSYHLPPGCGAGKIEGVKEEQRDRKRARTKIFSPGQRGELHSYASTFIFIHVFTIIVTFSMIGWEQRMLLRVFFHYDYFHLVLIVLTYPVLQRTMNIYIANKFQLNTCETKGQNCKVLKCSIFKIQ